MPRESRDGYIWISRWNEFQHYRPDSSRAPKWIKDYIGQMNDDRYLSLTDRQRALLRDLRDVFAMTLGRVPDDTRTISRHRHSQTRDEDLETLSRAGLIDRISRETLEQRLEEFYRSPRAEVEVDLDLEEEKALAVSDTRNGANPKNEQHGQSSDEQPEEQPDPELARDLVSKVSASFDDIPF